jgi:hypothetical protein
MLTETPLKKIFSLRWWLVASQPPELTIDSESETGKAVLR